MITQAQNAPVTEAHRKLAPQVAFACYGGPFEEGKDAEEQMPLDCETAAAQLIANFVASETAALREELELIRTLCASERQAKVERGDMMLEAEAQRDALAAQCALLREALAWCLNKEPSPCRCLDIATPPHICIAHKALAATPETASAELAELRKDKERLDAAETMFESFMCWRFENQPETAGNDWTNAFADGEPEIHGDSLRELIDNLLKYRANP